MDRCLVVICRHLVCIVVGIGDMAVHMVVMIQLLEESMEIRMELYIVAPQHSLVGQAD
jgi:hypothetical protein